MNTDGSGGFDLDHLLEQEFQRRVGGLQGPSPNVAQSAYHVFAIGGKSMSLLSTLTAAATTKAAAGLATAALVLGGGSVAATAATGSPNPAVWGKIVNAAVTTCKDHLTDGRHGIGQCVSALAKQKGAEQRAQHSQASQARQNRPTGKPTDLATGKPSSLPGGYPTGVPAGPPGSPPAALGGGHPTGAPVTPPGHP